MLNFKVVCKLCNFCWLFPYFLSFYYNQIEGLWISKLCWYCHKCNLKNSEEKKKKIVSKVAQDSKGKVVKARGATKKHPQNYHTKRWGGQIFRCFSVFVNTCNLKDNLPHNTCHIYVKPHSNKEHTNDSRKSNFRWEGTKISPSLFLIFGRQTIPAKNAWRLSFWDRLFCLVMSHANVQSAKV